MAETNKPKKFAHSKFKGKRFKRAGQKTGRAKGYDHHWESYRRRFLHANPKCYACGCRAVHVDHIQRVRDNFDLFTVTSNHMALCHSCHSIITMKFDVKFEQDLDGKVKWVTHERKMRKITIKIRVLKDYYHKKRRP